MNHPITLTAAAFADPLHPIAAPPGHHLRLEIDPPTPGTLDLTVRSITTAPNTDPHTANPPILFPATINAHAHLDLTLLGPQPWDHGGAFADWARMILNHRRSLADTAAPNHEHTTHDATAAGIRLTLAGPTAAIADIADTNTQSPHLPLAESPLNSISFTELFGFGQRAQHAIDHLPDLTRDTLHPPHPAKHNLRSLSPHAPYSADRRLYDAAAQHVRDAPHAPSLIATHLAEHDDERQLLTNAAGPMRDFLQHIGAWDDDTQRTFQTARSPVAFLAPHLRTTPALLAHVNDTDDQDIETLAELSNHWQRTPADPPETQASTDRTHAKAVHTDGEGWGREGRGERGGVVFCPRCHAYFGHEQRFGPHRFLDMLHAGVNVCLGTDSIVNLPPEQTDRLSTLDDARLLHRERRADPATLLRLITTNPAKAMGLDPNRFALPEAPAVHTLAGLAFCTMAEPQHRPHIADPNTELLEADDPAALVWDGERFHPALDIQATHRTP